ncbi:putative transmembrane anti-sigma factor [Caballeronia glathei]|jgi:anti-sigma factor RsiW|uniref:Anti-sigma factor n=1 Tax=Caballeronia glathei TaxID=60547 RepID=A0A069PMV6_9BURK|nr:MULTISPECIES: hypothetical protein [Burkholderiaceae]KDR42028.1 anti-sigma factor [Caballeronia glathei]TCK38922.1 anti-sigma factor RsiW [Paraburkholderia sp. BL8N3]CDY79176.1 putative transmembrane anti-sigma factor [Caballeronia glathei]
MNIDDTLLMAYVDNALSPDERQCVEKKLDGSAEAASHVALLRASRLPYQQAFAHQKLPPVPENLKRKIEQMVRAFASNDETIEQYGGGIAVPMQGRCTPRVAPAWLAVAFVAGAFGWAGLLRLGPGATPDIMSASASLESQGASPWVRAAANYQQLYTRDTLAHLDPDLRLSERIVDEIRRDDGIAVSIPDLSSMGLEFKRVQRLRFHDKPLVQIVYLPKSGGSPVALCVTKEAKPDHAIAAQDIDDMDVVTWRQAQQGYALIGKTDGMDLNMLGKQLSEGGGEQLY